MKQIQEVISFSFLSFWSSSFFSISLLKSTLLFRKKLGLMTGINLHVMHVAVKLFCSISTGRLKQAFFFFSFIRWKLQSPRWQWQYIKGPPGYRRACGLRECGLARFPFWAARRWGRTAAHVLLSDCQYLKGTALYGRYGVWNTGDGWGGCDLSWAWTLSLFPTWLKGSKGQSCTLGAWAKQVFKQEAIFPAGLILFKAALRINAAASQVINCLVPAVMWCLLFIIHHKQTL